MYADAVGTVRSHTWRTPVPRVDSRWGHRYSLSKFPSVGRIRGGGFSSPRHQGGGPCKPALAAGGGAGHRLTLVWPSGARRLEKKNRSQWLRTCSSWDRASTVVTCSGRIGTRWGGGRSQALLTVRWNGQSCATLGSAVSMIVVEWGGHGPWAMAEGARTAPRLEALTARQCQAQLIRQRISKPVLVRQGSESMSLCLDGSWHRCCAHRGASLRDAAQVRHCEPASVCEMCDHT